MADLRILLLPALLLVQASASANEIRPEDIASVRVEKSARRLLLLDADGATLRSDRKSVV